MRVSRQMLRRAAVTAAGTLLMGFGIALSVRAGLGTDPYTCLNLGVSARLGLSLGLWQMLMNFLFVVPPLLFLRRHVGLGTVLNIFCMGYLVELFTALMARLPQPGPAERLLLMAAGILTLGFSVAMYAEPRMGMAPYDAFSLVLAERLPGLPFRWWRVIQDVLAVAVGWLCGSVVGPGTLITAFCMGPVITAFGGPVRRWLLGQKNL